MSGIRWLSKYGIITGFWIFIPAPSLTMHTLNVQAVEAFKNHEHAKARELYTRMAPRSFTLYYNIGRCWYEEGNYIQAFIAWKRAYVFTNIRYLHLIQKSIKQCATMLDISEKEKSIIDIVKEYGITVIKSPSLLQWQIFFLTVWYLFFYHLYYYCIKRKTSLRRVIGMGIVWCIVLFFLHKRQWLYYEVYGLSGPAAINVYVGPDDQFHHVGLVKPFTDIIITGRDGEWSSIVASQISGWVVTKDIIML